MKMSKTLSALSATALVGAMLIGSVSDADARWRGRGGWGVGPAIVGGAAAGLLLGSALAGPRYYGPGPVYAAPGPATCLVDQEVWSPYYRAYVWRRVPVPC
jgi:hypothetical protein